MVFVPKKVSFFLILLFGCLTVLALDYFGIIWHNAPFAFSYEVKGIDISHHQNSIDWKKVAQTQRYVFVYMKATEGHDFIDDAFATNWKQAKEQGFLVGAYHFFSLRSPGAEQASFFIATVPKEQGTLPPVIDVEVDARKDPKAVRKELQDLATQLETYYEQKPILYVTYDTYHAYVEGNFADYDIWLRDVMKPPSLANKEWLMWQYSNRGFVPGIHTYVDLNVFRGTKEELVKLVSH